MIDFLEQMPFASGYEGVSNVLKGIKEWAEHENMPVGLVHQSGKSSTRGASRGMDDGKFNADEYAILQLNVFRKRDLPKLSEHEQRVHSVSISLDLCKNKRPPCQITDPPIDYFIDPTCGLVRLLITDGYSEPDGAVRVPAPRGRSCWLPARGRHHAPEGSER